MSKNVIIIWECARCPAVQAQSYPMADGQVSVEQAYPPAPFTYVRDPVVPESAYILCPEHYEIWCQDLAASQNAGDTLGIAVSEDIGMEEIAP